MSNSVARFDIKVVFVVAIHVSKKRKNEERNSKMGRPDTNQHPDRHRNGTGYNQLHGRNALNEKRRKVYKKKEGCHLDNPTSY